jgi:hypothetical protein
MPYIVEEDALAKKEESKIQLARRDHEEKSTEQRAAILGMPYLDTRPFENDLDLINTVWYHCKLGPSMSRIGLVLRVRHRNLSLKKPK